ncbi:hypothetical protein C1H76_6285 [Elsinoe australis]|uniref:Uncharacterized protein n=1 Tax=Elsinoe australis TaxID=40998 RepID=A0A4U7ATS7_9PEZI|nr:hypothetical protein C1H76_6285 [Elsinoe australis]
MVQLTTKSVFSIFLPLILVHLASAAPIDQTPGASGVESYNGPNVFGPESGISKRDDFASEFLDNDIKVPVQMTKRDAQYGGFGQDQQGSQPNYQDAGGPYELDGSPVGQLGRGQNGQGGEYGGQGGGSSGSYGGQDQSGSTHGQGPPGPAVPGQTAPGQASQGQAPSGQAPPGQAPTPPGQAPGTKPTSTWGKLTNSFKGKIGTLTRGQTAPLQPVKRDAQTDTFDESGNPVPADDGSYPQEQPQEGAGEPQMSDQLPEQQPDDMQVQQLTRREAQDGSYDYNNAPDDSSNPPEQQQQDDEEESQLTRREAQDDSYGYNIPQDDGTMPPEQQQQESTGEQQPADDGSYQQQDDYQEPQLTRREAQDGSFDDYGNPLPADDGNVPPEQQEQQQQQQQQQQQAENEPQMPNGAPEEQPGDFQEQQITT